MYVQPNLIPNLFKISTCTCMGILSAAFQYIYFFIYFLFIRTMLKEIYDLMVEEKEIPTMKTFEVASHTFGTANILNHLTVFDRLFEEYQSNLIFRQDVRNNNRKLWTLFYAAAWRWACSLTARGTFLNNLSRFWHTLFGTISEKI